MMRSRYIAAGIALSVLGSAGSTHADDWTSNAAAMNAAMKAFDKRQFFRMTDACTAEYATIAPNRGPGETVRVDLKGVNGESIENNAGSYTVPFNYSAVSYDCHRGQGKPNCTSSRVTFGTIPMKPGAEPGFCRVFLSAIAACQGVTAFKPSKRGCAMLPWEADFVKNGPPPKAKSRLGM